MIILGIDTSTDICSVALTKDGELISEYLLRQGYIHAERIPEAVSFVLNEACTDLERVDAIAVTSGPGSFTGLRIGVAFAKGLATGHNIPLIKIPTLECFVYPLPLLAEHACILVRSRKGEFYFQHYFNTNTRWESDMETEICREDDVVPLLEKYTDPIVTGYLTPQMKSKIKQSTLNAAIIDPLSMRCFASSAALMGVSRFQNGETVRPEQLTPVYLSKFLGAG